MLLAVCTKYEIIIPIVQHFSLLVSLPFTNELDSAAVCMEFETTG